MPNSEEPAETQWSHDFRDILAKELERVGEEVSDADPDPIKHAHQKQLVGLAFSGGGIRSATFNLGILQALARMKLLSKFDYLSTVSGGGYIGSWLMAWIKRCGIKDVRAGLRPERGKQPGDDEPQQIHFLRRFSNYLTPKLGWLGADMWTVITIYIRNVVLNFIVLGAAFALVLLVPRWIALGARLGWKAVPFPILALLALGALFAATIAMVRSMRYFTKFDPAHREPEIVKDLEIQKPWEDDSGKPVDVLSGTPAAWYAGQLFDDFILRADFEITGRGHVFIYVWSRKIVSKKGAAPGWGKRDVIHIACDGRDCELTGSINEQAPVRSALINPGRNTLEITCASDHCTVRINDETINRSRVKRMRDKSRWRFGTPRPLPSAVGIEKVDAGVTINHIEVEKIETAWSTGATQGQVQRRIIAPLFFAAFLATFLFGFGDHAPDEQTTGVMSMRQWVGVPRDREAWTWQWSAFVAGAVSTTILLGAQFLLALWRKRNPFTEIIRILPSAISIFFAAAVGGLIARALYGMFCGKTVWEVMVWGTPALLAAFFGTFILHIGLLGRRLSDERREWWSRLCAWLLIYALAWIGIFGLAFYAPVLLRKAHYSAQIWVNAVGVGWILSTVAGLIAGRSAATGKEKSNKLVEVVARVAPYIFVVGFLILLSCAVDALIRSGSVDVAAPGMEFQQLLIAHWGAMYGTDLSWLLWITLGLTLIAAVLSVRLDINQFSMHLLYRNRLARCYLGASNGVRRAQPFTGFSSDDDLSLSELSILSFSGPLAAPYPIINAALNLVGGKELAWQQRKAASFIFSPLYCGYEFPELPPGYCQTKKFAAKSGEVSLATAMAISGAAASPNMGYHTSPAPAFLMTVFNLRLGWWLGNPRREHGYQKSGPLNVLWSLVCELFGLTSDEGKYIYLSDGGHFENLGIYELVRRRCRFIVACDAEEDHTFGFGGLGNAIEKCRSDFGIDIDIDVEPIRRRSEKGHSAWHCAIGKIRYSRVDTNARDGILVYLKSSLTGDEPTDALRYAAANPGFPHQSTSDQWFDESQFESYRVLGFHVAENVFGAVSDVAKLTKEQLFVELAEQWYPPSAAIAESFTKHTRSVVAIYDELRENKNLAFLSEYIYPEWRVLFEKTGHLWSRSSKFPFDTERPLREQLPKTEAELRAGFYICNSVFQLFEDAYVDLHLEDEFDHPDNRGWMNLFKHWSWAPIVRVAWTICAGNYGARFQSFCERHLDLCIGETKAREVDLGRQIDFSRPSETFRWSTEIGKEAAEIAKAMWTWLRELPVGSNVIADALLKVMEKAPNSERPPKINEEEALGEAKKRIEDSLTAKNGRPIPLRASDRLDEEWYAAATLLEACRRKNVPEDVKLTWANDVAELVLSHGAITAGRILCQDFQDELNPVERQLVKLLFVFNPGVAASARLLRLEVTPDPHAPHATPQNRNLHFPFGFAILARTDWPRETGGAHKLVYFRVQDHLRRMGLARQALGQIFEREPALEVELKKMHPDACEVPSDKDRARFLRLCGSVKTAMKQKVSAGDPAGIENPTAST
jgi:predicted acylesterase/phospholipase RssA